MQIMKLLKTLLSILRPQKSPKTLKWYNVYRNPKTGRLYTGMAYESETTARQDGEDVENYIGSVKI